MRNIRLSASRGRKETKKAESHSEKDRPKTLYTHRPQARSKDFLREGGGVRSEKSGPQLSAGGAMGAPRTPFFNKKVDLSCLWGGCRHTPRTPPPYGP